VNISKIKMENCDVKKRKDNADTWLWGEAVRREGWVRSFPMKQKHLQKSSPVVL
jgi:hypothetical protein